MTSYEEAIRSIRGGMAIALGLSAIISVLMITGSIYMLQVYDRVLASGSVNTLLGLFAIVVVCYGFLAVYDAIRARLLDRMSAKIEMSLSRSAFAVSLETPGAVRPEQHLEAIRNFLTRPAATALMDLPFFAVFLAVLFVIHPALGWCRIPCARRPTP